MEDSEENQEIFKSITITVGLEGNQKKYEIPVQYNEEKQKYECKIKVIERNLENFIQEDDIIKNMQFNQFSVQMFDWIIKYMQAHKWQPVIAKTPIETGRLNKNLSEIDYKLITAPEIPKYNDPDTKQEMHLKNMYMAAKYFDIPELQTVIVVRIATEFYTGQNYQSYDDLKKKHNIKTDLTIEEESRINQWYVFDSINNQ